MRDLRGRRAGGGLDPAVRAMAAAMMHRGPDGDGFHDTTWSTIAQRRLDIIDRAGGAQPMPNEDGTRLEGMFAYAIVDDHRHEVFIARDRVGKKPLFYTVLGWGSALRQRTRRAPPGPFLAGQGVRKQAEGQAAG